MKWFQFNALLDSSLLNFHYYKYCVEDYLYMNIFTHVADYYYLERSYGSRISGSKTYEFLDSRYICCQIAF